MLPLFVVYVAQYLINQGVIELNIYDCAHSFRMGPNSQYMWLGNSSKIFFFNFLDFRYQVLYQIGAFVAASTISAAQLPLVGIYLLPAIQVKKVLTVIKFHQTINHSTLHICLIFRPHSQSCSQSTLCILSFHISGLLL